MCLSRDCLGKMMIILVSNGAKDLSFTHRAFILGSVSSSRVVYCKFMTRRHAVVQFV